MILPFFDSINALSVVFLGQSPHNRNVTVKAVDIRAGAALLIGASARLAETKIVEAHQIFRGYQNIIEDLKNLNIDIKTGGLQWKLEKGKRHPINGDTLVYP